jgi:hypothetical protein
MPPRLELREIERKAWLRTFEHGLWDIVIGLVLLAFGLSILTRIYWMTAVWVPLLVPGLRDLARRLVIPRIGHVTFKTRRRRSLARIQIILAALVVAGLGMFLLTGWSTRPDPPGFVTWVRSHMLVVIGIVWGGALAVAGWAASFPRLFAYAVLLFGVLLGADLDLGYGLGEGLVSVGSLIVGIGTFLLVRFVIRYPRRPVHVGEGTDD